MYPVVVHLKPRDAQSSGNDDASQAREGNNPSLASRRVITGVDAIQ
jgi:hypothetical protein